jgi:hypothetical protein
MFLEKKIVIPLHTMKVFWNHVFWFQNTCLL